MTDDEKIDAYLKMICEFEPDIRYQKFGYHLSTKTFEPNLVTRMLVEGLISSCDPFDQNGPIFYEATKSGRMIFYSGGYLSWIGKEKRKEHNTRRKEELEISISKYQFLHNKWLYKTRWWPHILSGLAFILSLVGLIKAI